MTEVEVLYADLTRQRKPLDEIDQLSTDGVLFIVVQTDEEEGKLRNIVACFGKDFYALCRQRIGGEDHIMLFGWDEDDFVFRRLTKIHEDSARRQVDAPLGVMHMIFSGRGVGEDVWKQAQDIFSKEMTV